MNQPAILKICLFIILTSLLATGCKKKPEMPPGTIASYKEEALQIGELNFHLPQNVSPTDSERFSQNYIRQWKKEQAICDFALRKYRKIEQEIEMKVRDYRRDMIIQAFNERILKDSLNLEVSDEEVQAYYDKQKENFIASEDKYSYYFVIVQNKSQAELQQLSKWLETGEEGINQAKVWAKNNAKNYKLDNQFVTEETLNQLSQSYFKDLKNIPEGKLIQWNGVIQGGRRTYFFKMLEKAKKGKPLPLTIVYNKIKSDILTRRQNKLIDDIHTQILENAQKQGYIH